MAAPLAGIRVVEVASWMAAPGAGAVLADLGADVIKVEPLGGDPVRGLMRPPRVPPGMPRIDYSFQVDNRGKRSVAVALGHPQGPDLVRRLVARAEVFVSNLLHERQARYGLDAESLLALNPSIVHATLSGYGPIGPDAWRPGYDVTAFFARGAITDSMTDAGATAPHPRPAQGDHAAALALVSALLAALRVAERTGEGQVVDVSLLGTAAWTMSTDLSAVLVDGRQPTRRDRHHQVSALVNRFPCGDGRWIVVNMPEPYWWPRFCEALGRKEWVEDPRFSDQRSRFDNMADLVELIDARLADKSLAEWGRVFDEHGLIWGPAATLSELAADPQAEATGLFPEVHHPEGSFRTVAAPFSIRGADVGPRRPAPGVGEHTAEVLGAAGVTGEELAALARAGVVAGPGLPEGPSGAPQEVRR